MKRVLAAILLLGAACTGDGGTEPTEPPSAALIAFLSSDGNVALYDPATEAERRITSDAALTRRYTQPTWSPDGARLAYVRAAAGTPDRGIEAAMVRTTSQAQDGVASAIHITTVADGATTVIETPFTAFYLYWSPDATKLAFLGFDPAISRQALGLIDLELETTRGIDIGQPYYFAWSPASDRMLVHARNAELYYLEPDGAKSNLDREPGSFSAPHWVGTTQVFPIQIEGEQQLTVFDDDGTRRRLSASPSSGVALALSPDEEQVAFIQLGEDSNPFSLGQLEVERNGTTASVAEGVSAFFWGPAGSRLLYLTGDVGDGEFSFRWNVWDGETSVAFEPHTPSGEFLQNYFPFFGQYANSLTFFSPDGTEFTFAASIDGQDGIWVQDVTGGPARLVADGTFATWAPG